jgi:hypothetical protein
MEVAKNIGAYVFFNANVFPGSDGDVRINSITDFIVG